MYILHVHVHVKPAHLDEFKQATNLNAANSRQEPGVARFDVIQQVDDPTRFILMEAYYSAEGYKQHKETAHFHTWNTQVTDWMFEPRTRTVFANISPEDQDW